MNPSPKRFKSPALFTVQLLLAAALVTLTACAGGRKTAGSDGPSLGDSSSESSAPVNTKVDDAKRSAEEAEQRAHELRSEKAKSQSKSSAN